ncbi:MAG TPA: biotin--[acetyl-CoA-carboxylase] ligase [Actinomycetota bacterium]|nr:biotin--[acetyl-CoA-carboxylase] ligase [Actinomycetota bacterium]
MLSEGSLRRALERAGLQAPVRYDEVTGSTQATALELASAGTPEWTLVAAGHQTEGRGRLGRTWSDEPGRSLMFSVVLRPELAPDAGGLVTLLAGSALARACREVAGQDAACKWPNDVLVDDRKAAGILAESRVADGRFEHVVIGIGANLREPPPEVPGAGAVQAEGTELLDAFLAAFVGGYRPADPAFGAEVISVYRGVCATLGTRVRATSDRGTIEGDAVDVDERGGLVVRTVSGDETVRFGEVERLE